VSGSAGPSLDLAGAGFAVGGVTRPFAVAGVTRPLLSGSRTEVGFELLVASKPASEE